MGAIDTSYTFTATDVITSAKMNNILDQSTITATAVFNNTLDVASGKLLVKAGGITSNELGAGAVTANSILNSSVTPEKLSNGGPSWTIGGTLSAAMFSGPITGSLTGNSSGTHTGAVIGNVTGNVTGNITGNSNGTHTGPVIGNVTGDLTGSVTGNTSGSSGSCTGNSATATTWQTPRNLALTGDVTATLLNVNGSSAISAVATISDNAVTTAKILNGNVTTLKILDGSITPPKLSNSDFGDFTVASGVATIDAGVVTFSKIATAAVATVAEVKVETASKLVTADNVKQSPPAAKAYGSFTTTVSSRILSGSYNVSVTRLTASTSQVTFTASMASAAYSVVAQTTNSGVTSGAGIDIDANAMVYDKQSTGFKIQHQSESTNRAIDFVVFGTLA